MKIESFALVISRIDMALKGRLLRKQFLVGPLGSGGPLHEPCFASTNAASLPDGVEADIELLAHAPFWSNYGLPVVIDAAKAVSLLAQDSDRSVERIEAVLVQARFTFMGTDGMRGKVASGPVAEPCSAYLAQNILSAELIGLASRAFALMALENHCARPGDGVVLGNDGRDKVSGWTLNSAMNAGFSAAGLSVVDMGLIPTPYVPWTMLKEGHPCGAVLTASHNPANQNGIKFFLDGKKLLPEGCTGDYALSAGMLALALEAIHQGTNPITGGHGSIMTSDGSLKMAVREAAADMTVAKLPADLGQVLKRQTLVLDSANGAFFGLAPAILDRLGLDWSTVNTLADGANINRGCGVAEIEGHGHFGSHEAHTALAIIQSLFKAGREGNRRIYGLALDGDGDRGFVLVYDPAQDDVLALNGDLCGYILADYFKKNSAAPEGHFVLTVESDLMTAYHARKNLGLAVGIVSVGDKWIGNYSGGSILMGLEASGHMMYPLDGLSDQGKPYQVLAGNGLVATLMVVYALEKDAWPMERIREPFPAGFAKTYYTFFVDKSRFYRGSTAWNADRALLESFIASAKASGTLPSSLVLVFEDKEDVNMLYGAIYDGADQVAAVFARNSGTEDKTAAYVQCRKELAPALLPLGEVLALAHRHALKNPERLEYRVECALLARLASAGSGSFTGLHGAVEADLGLTLASGDFYGVVYGLKKEGRVRIDADSVLSLGS